MNSIKKLQRETRNKEAKVAKAAARAAAADVPTLEAMPDKTYPRLTWLNGKQYAHHGAQSKTRPGNKELHAEANIANAAFVPPGFVPVDPTKVTIGEFADHDPQQGAAIDHSIATGEPLFAENK
jgi:hypothetical protein